MAKCIEYCIKIKTEGTALLEGKYLQGIEANQDYGKDAIAPTMGARHSYYEYTTIWGTEPKFFEPLTLANYIKIMLEENRWETKSIYEFEVIKKWL